MEQKPGVTALDSLTSVELKNIALFLGRSSVEPCTLLSFQAFSF